MPRGTITDVVPVSSSTNVIATIQDAFGITHYSAADLAQPLKARRDLQCPLGHSAQPGHDFFLTFGTDTSLKTAAGWDNVTGLGTPNGKALADFFNPAR